MGFPVSLKENTTFSFILRLDVNRNIKVKVFLFYSETGKVLTTMKAGDFFGEIGILNLDGLNK